MTPADSPDVSGDSTLQSDRVDTTRGGYPRGIVIKIDPFNSNERALFRGHEAVPFLQVKYGDSNWLLDNPVTDLLGSNQQLILVDWEDGEKAQEPKPRRCSPTMS